MKEISGTIRIFSYFYPGENLMNLYNLLSPYMLHPLYKVLQLVTVLITTILRSSLQTKDFCAVRFMPFIIRGLD